MGHRLEEELGEVYVVGVGYEARPGREAYGSLGGAAFRHLGVDYTVSLLTAAGTQDLYLATTPNLPADGDGLTLHVQTYGGELDAPLAEGVFQSGTQDLWFFRAKVGQTPSTPLSDVSLLRYFDLAAHIDRGSDLGTEVAVRLSYASTLPPGPDGGVLRGLLLHGLGGRRPGDGGGGAERGAVGAGDDSADAVAPGRRHGGGLLGRAAERDVPGRGRRGRRSR